MSALRSTGRSKLAYEQGFPVDTISTDLHSNTLSEFDFDMRTTMNKVLNIGAPLSEVIERSTVIPARHIGRPELGTLSVGTEADIAVFDLQQGDFTFIDCGRARLQGSQLLSCALTIRAGELVYDPHGFTLPEWQSAPLRLIWRTPRAMPGEPDHPRRVPVYGD